MALNAQEIINYIADSPKKTPVKIYVNLSAPVDFGSAEVFGEGESRIVFGDWAELAPILEDNREKLDELAKFLYEKETITGEEFMEILTKGEKQ